MNPQFTCPETLPLTLSQEIFSDSTIPELLVSGTIFLADSPEYVSPDGIGGRITGGTGTVYGGGDEFFRQGDVRIEATGGNGVTIYGGGLNANLEGNVIIAISGGSFDSIFGGGRNGSVQSAAISLTGENSTANNVYGTVSIATALSITVKAGARVAGYICGSYGEEGVVLGSVSIQLANAAPSSAGIYGSMDGGTIGGHLTISITGNAGSIISTRDGAISGRASITVSDGSFTNLFAGGVADSAGAAVKQGVAITLVNASNTGSVIAGGQARQTGTSIRVGTDGRTETAVLLEIAGSNLNWVSAGGSATAGASSYLYGDVRATVTDSVITHLYGGGFGDTVYGDIILSLSGSEFSLLSGSGDACSVSGDLTIGISNSSGSRMSGTGAGSTIAGVVALMITNCTFDAIYGNNGSATGSVTIAVTGENTIGSLTGSWGAAAVVDGDVAISISTGTTVNQALYGAAGEVRGNITMDLAGSIEMITTQQDATVQGNIDIIFTGTNCNQIRAAGLSTTAAQIADDVTFSASAAENSMVLGTLIGGAYCIGSGSVGGSISLNLSGSGENRISAGAIYGGGYAAGAGSRMEVKQGVSIALTNTDMAVNHYLFGGGWALGTNSAIVIGTEGISGTTISLAATDSSLGYVYLAGYTGSAGTITVYGDVDASFTGTSINRLAGVQNRITVNGDVSITLESSQLGWSLYGVASGGTVSGGDVKITLRDGNSFTGGIYGSESAMQTDTTYTLRFESCEYAAFGSAIGNFNRLEFADAGVAFTNSNLNFSMVETFLFSFEEISDGATVWEQLDGVLGMSANNTRLLDIGGFGTENGSVALLQSTAAMLGTEGWDRYEFNVNGLGSLILGDGWQDGSGFGLDGYELKLDQNLAAGTVLLDWRSTGSSGFLA